MHTYPLYRYGGLIYSEIDGKRVVIDTGAPVSMGWGCGVTIGDRTHHLQSDYGDLFFLRLKDEMRCDIDAVVGTDILTHYEAVFDLEAETLSLRPPSSTRPEGAQPLSSVGCVPVVRALADGRAYDLFLDTGTRATFIPSASLAAFAPDGHLRAYSPALGWYGTDTHPVPFELDCRGGPGRVTVPVGSPPDEMRQLFDQTPVEGSLGNAILENFRVTLNLAERWSLLEATEPTLTLPEEPEPAPLVRRARTRERPVTTDPVTSWTELFHFSSGVAPHPLLSVPRPTTLWYPSAGWDFRPLVYLMPTYKERLELDVPTPELFVYTNLTPNGGLPRFRIGGVLYDDRYTRVTVRSAQHAYLNRALVDYYIDGDFFAFDTSDPRGWGSDRPECQLIDVEVQSKTGMGCGVFTVLYIHMENNNCFDTLMARGAFDWQYLCVTREGRGFGGCRRSVLQHLYDEGRLQYAMDAGCDPRYVMTWDACSGLGFPELARDRYPDVERKARYIGESGVFIPHHLYQLY